MFELLFLLELSIKKAIYPFTWYPRFPFPMLGDTLLAPSQLFLFLWERAKELNEGKGVWGRRPSTGGGATKGGSVEPNSYQNSYPAPPDLPIKRI